MRSRYLLFLVILTVVSTVPVTAADWPAWRGLDATGVSTETDLPSTWTPDGKNMLWKASIGGRSTPIVINRQVCLITLAEPNEATKWQERVVCLNADTGKINWEYRYNVFQTDIPHHRVGWANLVGDEKTGYIYSHGVEGMMYCFAPNGTVVWSRSLGEEVGRISGFGGRTVNPVIDGDLVIVSFLTAGWGSTYIPRHRFYALDKITGETIWVSTPGDAPKDTTYSAPVIRVIKGERLVIGGNGDGSIYAIRASTGEKVWGFPISKRGINSSVVVDGNLIYASHSEENIDESTAMGRLVCLDAGVVSDGKPKLVWMVDGFTGGYSSPAIHAGRLYHVDNSANLVAFDTKTGKELWKHNIGIAQKASPVVADGKIYVADVDGKFHILKLNGDSEPEIFDIDEFKEIDGSATQINSSPAIANGRIYLLTNTHLYAIGTKKFSPRPAETLPGPTKKAPSGSIATWIRVTPSEGILSAGRSKQFKVYTFDSKGRRIGQVDTSWSLEGLDGSISNNGNLQLSQKNISQSGSVVASVGTLKGSARISVRPRVPFREDFDALDIDGVPAGWNATRGRFQIVLQGTNKVLKKLSRNPRTWRTTVYIGNPNAKSYVMEADIKGSERRRRMPDIGLVSHRYTIALMGNAQKLMVRTWLSELARFSKEVRYRWDPNIWYRMKVRVDSKTEAASIRAKVWKRDELEPIQWTIEAKDLIPHRQGAPGIYGYSSADIFYDNIVLTSIKK
jgi:outer membrane protein assembly factor BamB